MFLRALVSQVMTLDLSDEETAALTRLLSDTIDADRSAFGHLGRSLARFDPSRRASRCRR
jgi:hypothetical protein